MKQDDSTLFHGDKKKAIADVCLRLYEKNYLVATSGNVSIRTENGFFITPRQMRKDAVTPDEVVECSSDGKTTCLGKTSSSETPMHREVYLKRKDVNAAIHAHPPYCLACSLSNISLTEMLLPELVVYVGPVPLVPYATPGTEEMVEVLRDYIADHNAFLLKRHGVLVLGKDIEDAFNRLEHLEHTARVTYLARTIGTIKPLTSSELVNLAIYAQEVGYKFTTRILEKLGIKK